LISIQADVEARSQEEGAARQVQVDLGVNRQLIGESLTLRCDASSWIAPR
jgi:hypothetical protein